MRIFHCVNTYAAQNQRENERMGRAQATWAALYAFHRGLFVPAHSGRLGRDARSIGDVRAVPFLRDVVGAAPAGDEDCIVLTNADSSLVRDAMNWILPTVLGRGYGWSERRDTLKIQRAHLTQQDILDRCEPFIGCDLFAFTIRWWREQNIPDVLMGYESWDWILKYSMGLEAQMPALVYHEFHQYPYWHQHRKSAPGNLYNRGLAWEWAKDRPDYSEMVKVWKSLPEYRNDGAKAAAAMPAAEIPKSDFVLSDLDLDLGPGFNPSRYGGILCRRIGSDLQVEILRDYGRSESGISVEDSRGSVSDSGSENLVSGVLEPDSGVLEPAKSFLLPRGIYACAEDGRLWQANGEIWASYSVYEQASQTAMAVCQVGDSGMRVLGFRRQNREKNWGFFEFDGRVMAVYRPGIVLEFDSAFEVVKIWESSRVSWRYGEIRGGAPPVRVGGKYWSFFHSSSVSGGKLRYYGGLYTFEARPPFAFRAMIPVPILMPPRPEPLGKSVAYPGSAELVDGIWSICYGAHDLSCRVCTMSHSRLLEALQ